MTITEIIKSTEWKWVIYLFECPIWKKYIGQSINFKERYRRYKWNTNSIWKYFSNAIKKYNWIANFKLSILHTIDINSDIQVIKEELDKLEIFYIEKHKSNKLGYNLTWGWGWSYKRLISEDTRKKISEANKWKNTVESICINCGYCKKEFLVRPFYYRRKLKTNKDGKIYCSINCQHNSLKIDYIHINCGYCQKEFLLKPSFYRTRLKKNKNKQLFCSKTCWYDSLRTKK